MKKRLRYGKLGFVKTVNDMKTCYNIQSVNFNKQNMAVTVFSQTLFYRKINEIKRLIVHKKPIDVFQLRIR